MNTYIWSGTAMAEQRPQDWEPREREQPNQSARGKHHSQSYGHEHASGQSKTCYKGPIRRKCRKYNHVFNYNHRRPLNQPRRHGNKATSLRNDSRIDSNATHISSRPRADGLFDSPAGNNSGAKLTSRRNMQASIASQGSSQPSTPSKYREDMARSNAIGLGAAGLFDARHFLNRLVSEHSAAVVPTRDTSTIEQPLSSPVQPLQINPTMSGAILPSTPVSSSSRFGNVQQPSDRSESSATLQGDEVLQAAEPSTPSSMKCNTNEQSRRANPHHTHESTPSASDPLVKKILTSAPKSMSEPHLGRTAAPISNVIPLKVREQMENLGIPFGDNKNGKAMYKRIRAAFKKLPKDWQILRVKNLEINDVAKILVIDVILPYLTETKCTTIDYVSDLQKESTQGCIQRTGAFWAARSIFLYLSSCEKGQRDRRSFKEYRRNLSCSSDDDSPSPPTRRRRAISQIDGAQPSGQLSQGPQDKDSGQHDGAKEPALACASIGTLRTFQNNVDDDTRASRHDSNASNSPGLSQHHEPSAEMRYPDENDVSVREDMIADHNPTTSIQDTNSVNTDVADSLPLQAALHQPSIFINSYTTETLNSDTAETEEADHSTEWRLPSEISATKIKIVILLAYEKNGTLEQIATNCTLSRIRQLPLQLSQLPTQLGELARAGKLYLSSSDFEEFLLPVSDRPSFAQEYEVYVRQIVSGYEANLPKLWQEQNERLIAEYGRSELKARTYYITLVLRSFDFSFQLDDGMDE